MAETALVWLRNDLRLADNPALSAAVARSGKVVAVHIDETDPTLRKRGAASRWWLHHSLNAMGRDLAAIGIALETVRGATGATLRDAIKRHSAGAVFWNRRYGPAERAIDSAIKAGLKRDGVVAESFAGDALVEPFDLATKSGGPYGVYTPFWNSLRQREIAVPLPAPKRVGDALPPHRLDTAYVTPGWAHKFEQYWKIGETAAKAKLAVFLDEAVGVYPGGRDFPAKDATSKLSPHLAFGEISPRQVWHATMALAARVPEKTAPVEKFLRELAWRDFNIHQLYYRADIATVPMQEKFGGLEWRTSEADLRAWQRGETGIPLVDAGMRELWETGFMQNRVRMVVASLLAKNLLLDWRLGEQWFWDTLLDADPANNPGNWQWVAGCGLDAAPYFRIFNPLTQAERFDPDGTYVKRWAPEVREPIVDLKASRERALAAFKAL